LNARQEDQRRRQLLEKEWRKAGRIDLLGSESSMNIQPEEDLDDDESDDETGELEEETETDDESEPKVTD